MVIKGPGMILKAFDFNLVHIYTSTQKHLYETHLNREFLHHLIEQWVLCDIKFAASGEPDHVSFPVLPIAESNTPGLAPVAPACFSHLDSSIGYLVTPTP